MTLSARQNSANNQVTANHNGGKGATKQPNDRYGGGGVTSTDGAEFYPPLSATLTNEDGLSRTATQKSEIQLQRSSN